MDKFKELFEAKNITVNIKKYEKRAQVYGRTTYYNFVGKEGLYANEEDGVVSSPIEPAVGDSGFAFVPFNHLIMKIKTLLKSTNFKTATIEDIAINEGTFTLIIKLDNEKKIEIGVDSINEFGYSLTNRKSNKSLTVSKNSKLQKIKK